MASPAVQNTVVQSESKSAKKKKGKAERTESPAPASTMTPDKAGSVAGGDAAQDDGETPYIRELQKNIRNVNKKITNASRTDNVIAEHKDKSLDELVQLKIINADQKAQVLNKPRLQSQLAQLEEQLAQYKKIDQEYRARAVTDKAELEKVLADKYEKEKATAVDELKEKSKADSEKTLRDSLLVLSQFLRLAASRRAEDTDADLDENRALEGVLLQVYSGDETGVDTMLKLVQGSHDQTKSVTGEDLETTYSQVREAAITHSVPLFLVEAESSEPETKAPEPATDPTIANAGLTEIDTGVDVALTNGHAAEESPLASVPSNAEAAADGAANAAAEAQWDAGNASMSASQEWVEVPRDPAETETGLNATPAAAANTQSWADDAAEHAAEMPVQADPNDGFQSVQRNRGRGDREGGWRGGNRGGYRGRGGFRGDGRGRGRGRGGNGSFRGGQRRSDES